MLQTLMMTPLARRSNKPVKCCIDCGLPLYYRKINAIYCKPCARQRAKDFQKEYTAKKSKMLERKRRKRKCVCLRCGYVWYKRIKTIKPNNCAGCNSVVWWKKKQ